MGLHYDPELPFWRTLFNCSGSVIPMVARTPMFILELLFHVALLGLDRFVPVNGVNAALDNSSGGSIADQEEVVLATDGDDGSGSHERRSMLAAAYSAYCGDYARVWSPAASSGQRGCMFLWYLEWRAVAAVTALLTFFIVFYGSQSYARFRFFYSHCVGMSGTAMNWTTLVRNHLPRDGQLQWNATRLILASMHLQYYTLNDSAAGAAISADEERRILERNLLTPLEMQRIRAYKGFKPYLPLVWAQREVSVAIEASDNLPRCDAMLMHHFRDLAFVFRGHCGQITNELIEPVPFPYFHMLTLLLFADLLAISWSLVTLGFHPLLTVLIYMLLCLLFIGLKEVAVQMSNPFGDDTVDFDVERFLRSAYNNSVAMLQDDWKPYGPNVAPVALPQYGIHSLQYTRDKLSPRRNGTKTGEAIGAGDHAWQPSLAVVDVQQRRDMSLAKSLSQNQPPLSPVSPSERQCAGAVSPKTHEASEDGLAA